MGKKLAQRIIISRQQQKFTSLQDFERVPGVSTRTVEKWSVEVTNPLTYYTKYDILGSYQ